MKQPPSTSGCAFAVDLLGRPARVVHRVVPGGKPKQEDAHEEQQREDLDEEGEPDHDAAPRAPERQQLKNLVGTAIAFVLLIGLTVLVIVSENLLDVTKAHKAGG